MNYAAYKRDFIYQLSKSGECTPNSAEPWVVSSVPEAVRAKWLAKFYRAERPTVVPVQPRLLNHFKLGADPEFAMGVQRGGELSLANAEQMGLIAGLCVGADNNGRLVELRPAPSRFALEVVASMLSELRWLAVMKPKTASFSWKAGAYSGHDGLGGHVHFGRKRFGPVVTMNGLQQRASKLEIDALDQLTRLLMVSEVYNMTEMAERRANTQGGHYGLAGDFRQQSHGYEYRTLPSWLNSPWLAYLSLTLAKLVVCDPDFFKNLPAELTQAGARKWIRNTLARYKGLDEDARLAFLGLDVWGLPKAIGYPLDFKPAWGMLPPQNDALWRATPFEVPKYLPPTLKPSQADVEDIFQNICFGRPIQSWLPTPPTWEFQTLPAGYAALQTLINTRVSPGLGELVWDGVIPAGLQINLTTLPKDHRAIYISPDMQCVVGLNELRTRYPNVKFEVHREHGPHFVIFTRQLLTPANAAYAKQIFYSGLFPVARYDNLATLNLEKVCALYASQNKARKSNCQVLYES